MSPGTTDLAPEEAAALDRLKDGSCDVGIVPLMPLLVSYRQRLVSSGEGPGARRTLREEHGGLADLLSYRCTESVYGLDGKLIEWRTNNSFLLGIQQDSASGSGGEETASSWRLLGGLLGREIQDGKKRTLILWLPL